MVRAAWHDLPNHVHGIIVLVDAAGDVDVGAGFPRRSASALVRAGTPQAPTDDVTLKPAPTQVGAKRHGLPEIVRAFKTFSARRINRMRGTPGTPVWQRNYFEHVIRNERELNAVRQYIHDNPQRWHLDRENPNVARPVRKDA
jgi:putative transposase